MPTTLLLTNISKRPNALAILRTCLAFGIPVVVHGMHNLVPHILNLYNKLCDVPASFGPGSAGLTPLNIINCMVDPTAAAPFVSRVPRESKVHLEDVKAIIVANTTRSVKLCAIEIPDLEKYKDKMILPVDELKVDTFEDDDVLLMLGNEGSGCSEKQLGISDCFLWCKQFTGDTASFNVAIAFAIVAERVYRIKG